MDDRYFFDNLADSWDDNEVLSTPEKVRSILGLMNLSKGDSVLDLGTGTGVLLPFVAEKIGEKGKITAVDYSAGMLRKAVEKYSCLKPEPEFVNIDFENENIEGEYDKIIMYCVYPHLHEPVETLKWLINVNLKPQGELYIAFPCIADYINNIHKERHSESDLLPSAESLARSLTSSGITAKMIIPDYIIRITR